MAEMSDATVRRFSPGPSPTQSETPIEASARLIEEARRHARVALASEIGRLTQSAATLKALAGLETLKPGEREAVRQGAASIEAMLTTLQAIQSRT